MKEYTVTLTLLVDEDADFFETDNGHNLDVLEEVFEEMVYDQSDMKLKEIEVEYTGD
jgi:hypothetical protein